MPDHACTFHQPMKHDFIVFAIGSPHRAKTWSNVPFFFTRTLEQQGYRVMMVNIAPPRLIQLLFDVPWRNVCRLVGYKTRFSFLRSALNRWFTKLKIKRTLALNPEGHCVFMTYSFGAGKGRPYTLFCDQTFEQLITYFDERKPNRLEVPAINEERQNLLGAELVIALFPESAKALADEYGGKVKYYGNVINLEQVKVDPAELLARKRNSNEVLFIGNRKYMEGLQVLAEAVKLLNRGTGPQVTVHVVGMERKDLPKAPANMRFHGYLDKDVPSQKSMYIDLLERCRLFINPTPKWASFSASCEALYYYTPVMIVPYNEFTRTFGDVNGVGYALASSNPRKVAEAIGSMFADEETWMAKAMAGHQATGKMSWDRYVRHFLDDLAEVEHAGERTRAQHV